MNLMSFFKGGLFPGVFRSGKAMIYNNHVLKSFAGAGNTVYTAADILGGIIVRDCAGASRSDTLPTAALLAAAIPGVKVGDIVRCHFINGSDPTTEVVTIGLGAGMSWDSSQDVASRVVLGGCSKDIFIRFTTVSPNASAAATVFL